MCVCVCVREIEREREGREREERGEGKEGRREGGTEHAHRLQQQSSRLSSLPDHNGKTPGERTPKPAGLSRTSSTIN